jgi:hypothetical protein
MATRTQREADTTMEEATKISREVTFRAIKGEDLQEITIREKEGTSATSQDMGVRRTLWPREEASHTMGR